jgi:integrase
MNLLHSSSDVLGADTHSENTVKHCAFKGEILTVALHLRKHGYSHSYLATLIRALKKIAKHVNLNNPNDVLDYIARKNVRDSYKANLCDFYKHYADYHGIPFTKPKYRRDHKLPYVPTREEINLIISHASKKYALIYSIMRDTGLRPVEVSDLTPDDIDLENGKISVYSAKHGKPRTVKVKQSTLAMLKNYIQKHNFKTKDKLFPPSEVISNTFCRLRSSLAKKLQNPKLKKIRLYDFRHYYATKLYYETRDILLVKEMLGHKNINNTIVYTHLVRIDDDEDKYYSATAKTVEKARKLVEQGFEYVCEIEGVKIFRKRK